MAKILDLLDKKFGKLTVLEFSYTKKGKAYWLCRCDCGNEKIIRSQCLQNGSTRSCGCLQKEIAHDFYFQDITGLKFNRLTIIKYDHTKRNLLYWLCKCDCGTEKIIRGSHIKSGKIKSCGCYNKEIARQHSGEKHEKWRGGNSKLKKYSKSWNMKLREEIRNRDNHKCQFQDCNYDDTKEKRKLSVHHINSDKQNCEAYNLICLCPKHHMIVENKPYFWQDYFYNITFDYYNGE